MVEFLTTSLIFFSFPLFFVLLLSVKVVMEYQRGVIFTFGKFSRIANPGINILIPFIQTIRIIDTRITTVDIPKQEVMTKDNVPVFINAVIYMRVIDTKKAVLKINNYVYAVSQYGQTALRDVIGNKELDEVLTERDTIAKEIKELVDRETDEWGVDITAIKIQDIELPANMKRAMARQAEAEREKRGAIIKSEGEKIAAENLSKAAKIMATTPGALHLRTLQTLSDISGDASTKIVLGIPMEILKAFESITEKTNKKQK